MAKKSLIIDAGFWIALADKKDAYHPKAVKTLKLIEDHQWITTWPVLTEASHYFIQWNDKEFLQFFHNLSLDICEIFPLESTHLPRIHHLLNKYRNLPMDLADASLVILAEELGAGDIVSTDQRDFQSYRWKTRLPFNNLMD